MFEIIALSVIIICSYLRNYDGKGMRGVRGESNWHLNAWNEIIFEEEICTGNTPQQASTGDQHRITHCKIHRLYLIFRRRCTNRRTGMTSGIFAYHTPPYRRIPYPLIRRTRDRNTTDVTKFPTRDFNESPGAHAATAATIFLPILLCRPCSRQQRPRCRRRRRRNT